MPLQHPVIAQSVLENGLRVITLERHEAPVVSSQIWYRVGSADELPGEYGLAHFLEHMMFKGTDRYDKGEIDQLTLKLGGGNNAATYKDWTYYHFDFAADRWTTALEIEANRMRHLRFDPEEFEAERKVVIEELQVGRDSPWVELDETAEAVAYLAHPYRNPVIGWKTDLLAVPLERLRAFYDRWYHPRNACLVLVGEFETRPTLEEVRRLFGDIPSGPEPNYRRTREPVQSGERRVVVHRETELARVEILYHTVPAGTPEDTVLEVIRHALVTGKSSRLGRRLIEKDRLATFVDAANDARRDPGLFTIYAELREGVDIATAEASIHEETKRISQEALDEDELARARKTALADLTFDRATAEHTAEEIGSAAVLSDYRVAAAAEARIRGVGSADVLRVARLVFRAENRTVAIAPPSNGVGSGSSPALHLRPARSPREPAHPRGPEVRISPSVVPLSNGLLLLLAQNRTVPVLAIDAWVDAGRLHESAPGLARFTGEALLEGANGRCSIALDKEFGRLGAGVETSGEGARVRCRIEDAEPAVALLADLLRRPEFPRRGLERVRERTLSELRAEEDEPQRVAGTAFHALVYGTHPLGRPERGTRESVAALGGEDVRDHHRRFFVPGNTVIAAVSCLAPDRIVPWFERAFADWSGTAPEPPTIPPVPVAVPRRMAIARDSDQVNVMLGHSGIRRDDPDYYGLLVMDHVLGLGPGLTDRLSRRLRDGEGLAYSVWATITKSAAREPGTFMAFIGTSAEQKQRAIDGIVAEIERIRMEPVAAEELENAKSYLTGSFVFGYETAEQLAARLVDLHRHALSFDYPRRFAERVRAVTPEDVLEVARRHLHPEALTIVTVGP